MSQIFARWPGQSMTLISITERFEFLHLALFSRSTDYFYQNQILLSILFHGIHLKDIRFFKALLSF